MSNWHSANAYLGRQPRWWTLRKMLLSGSKSNKRRNTGNQTCHAVDEFGRSTSLACNTNIDCNKRAGRLARQGIVGDLRFGHTVRGACHSYIMRESHCENIRANWARSAICTKALRSWPLILFIFTSSKASFWPPLDDPTCPIMHLVVQ